MTDKYQVEVLLRPPVEWMSSILSAMVAWFALDAPHRLMMTPSIATLSAAILLSLSVHRGCQGWRVTRYQQMLKRNPRYFMSANKIPVSKKGLFLGRGFQWTQKHTERLYAARSKDAESYVQPAAIKRWLRRKEFDWEYKPVLKDIAKLTATDSILNPFRPPPPTGGEPLIHGVGIEEESNVFMPLSERSGHTAVIARTRHGKTRLAEILITQDIHRKENNCVVIFDPKGDSDLLKRCYIEAKKAGREFILFHLGYPDLSARYNAIGSFSRITEPATRTTNALPGEGDARAFKDFAWQFVNVINVALFALGERPDYVKIRRYISDIDPLFVRYAKHWLRQNGPEHWEQQLSRAQLDVKPNRLGRAEQGREIEAIALARYIKELDEFDPILEGLMSVFRYEREYFQKITAAIKPLLEKLTTGKVADIISPDLTNLDDERPVLDWLEAIRKRAVVFVALDALTDPEVASVVGESAFSDLTSLCGRLYKHSSEHGLPELGQKIDPPKVIIHGDEFSDLIGPQFKTLINKSGQFYQMTLYTQTWSDVVAELGDPAKAGQLAGNIGTLIMMGVKEPTTCEMMTKTLPEVNVSEVMSVSSATDVNSFEDGITFTAQNQDRISVSRVPLISPADIVALPKGQAFALLNGSQLWKLRFPMPTKSDDEELPDNLENMLCDMKERYVSNVDWSQFQDESLGVAA